MKKTLIIFKNLCLTIVGLYVIIILMSISLSEPVPNFITSTVGIFWGLFIAFKVGVEFISED